MVVEEAVRWRVIRAILGIDQEALARKIDSHPNSIRNWEKGRTVPNTTSRKKLAEICREHNIAIRPDGFPVPE